MIYIFIRVLRLRCCIGVDMTWYCCSHGYGSAKHLVSFFTLFFLFLFLYFYLFYPSLSLPLFLGFQSLAYIMTSPPHPIEMCCIGIHTAHQHRTLHLCDVDYEWSFSLSSKIRATGLNFHWHFLETTGSMRISWNSESFYRISSKTLVEARCDFMQGLAHLTFYVQVTLWL